MRIELMSQSIQIDWRQLHGGESAGAGDARFAGGRRRRIARSPTTATVRELGDGFGDDGTHSAMPLIDAMRK
jgi:hypothetical protein